MGGPEPSILDDFCLGNVISKYFSKLRFGTSWIQPALKCLEKILSSFHGSLLRTRLCEHELFSVRSTSFICTVVKSPDETWTNTKHFCVVSRRGYYIIGPVSSLLHWKFRSPAIASCDGTRRKSQLPSVRFGKIIARAFWKLRQFSIRVTFQKKHLGVSHRCSNQELLYSQPTAQPSDLSWFNVD